MPRICKQEVLSSSWSALDSGRAWAWFRNTFPSTSQGYSTKWRMNPQIKRRREKTDGDRERQRRGRRQRKRSEQVEARTGNRGWRGGKGWWRHWQGKTSGNSHFSFWEDQSQWYIRKTSICFMPSSISINHCASQIGVLSLSTVLLFATLWIVAHQAPLPMGFSRQEHWSG